jgi:hypothetical protein
LPEADQQLSVGKADGLQTPKSRRSLLSRSSAEADIAHVAKGDLATAGSDLFPPAGEQILGIPFRLDFSLPELLYEFAKQPIVLRFASSHAQTNADLWLLHFDRFAKLDRGSDSRLQSASDTHTLDHEQRGMGPTGMGFGPMVVYQNYADCRRAMRHLDFLATTTSEPGVGLCGADVVRRRRGSDKSPATSSAYASTNLRYTSWKALIRRTAFAQNQVFR